MQDTRTVYSYKSNGQLGVEQLNCQRHSTHITYASEVDIHQLLCYIGSWQKQSKRTNADDSRASRVVKQGISLPQSRTACLQSHWHMSVQHNN
jgi:hypothetical protein